MRTMLVSTCVLTALVLGLGCQQTREVGRSARELFTGKEDATVERTPAQVSDAIDAVVARLDLIRIGATTKPAKDDEAGETTIVTLRNAADQKVELNYRPVTDTTTFVAVGTGAFGDSELRQQVWDELRLELGLLGATAAPAPAADE